MADASDPQAGRSPAPEEMHWGIAYLREDIQDLRQQMRDDIHDVRNQIGKTNERIDETNENINARFKWLMTTMVALTGVIIAVIKLGAG